MLLLGFAAYGPQVPAQTALAGDVTVKCPASQGADTDLDKLATALSSDFEVYRVQESVVVRLAVSTFFDDRSETLTLEGQRLISTISRNLFCYPDTFVYIQQNSGPTTASKLKAEEQAFLIRTALIETGIDVNRIDIDISTPSQARRPVKLGNKEVPPLGFFELIIIPRV